jgi:hypothetical protein
MTRRTVARPISERFWEKVDRRGRDECWPWTAASRHRFGYGTFHVSAAEGTVGAHRLAYELERGPIPPGMSVLHRCDNPPCCNPGHLFLGTPADNTADMDAKGRSRRLVPPGERNPNARLSAADVREIRRAYQAAPGVRAELARRYGVTPRTIWAVATRRTWRHLV